LQTIWKEEGFRGLYKGMIPGLLGVSHGALQFMAYEELKKFFVKQNDGDINKLVWTCITKEK
jgi:solute carrier family 25 folate transporter 32